MVLSGAVQVPITETSFGKITTGNEQMEKVEILNMETEEAVRSYFSDIPVMIEIARCESTFQHTLENGTVIQGKVDPADTGVMQINRRYHGKKAEALGLDLTNLYDNMVYARDLYVRQGTQPWKASSQCWSKSIAMR